MPARSLVGARNKFNAALCDIDNDNNHYQWLRIEQQWTWQR